jgi:hypothetical protein
MKKEVTFGEAEEKEMEGKEKTKEFLRHLWYYASLVFDVIIAIGLMFLSAMVLIICGFMKAYADIQEEKEKEEREKKNNIE